MSAELLLSLPETRRAGQQLDRPLLKAHALSFRLFVKVLMQGGADASQVLAAVGLRLFGRLRHLRDDTAFGILLASRKRTGAIAVARPTALGGKS